MTLCSLQITLKWKDIPSCMYSPWISGATWARSPFLLCSVLFPGSPQVRVCLSELSNLTKSPISTHLVCRGAHSESSTAWWLFWWYWQTSRACSMLASAPPDGRTTKSISQGCLPTPCGVNSNATQKLSPRSLRQRHAGHHSVPQSWVFTPQPACHEWMMVEVCLLSMRELGFLRYVTFFLYQQSRSFIPKKASPSLRFPWINLGGGGLNFKWCSGWLILDCRDSFWKWLVSSIRGKLVDFAQTSHLGELAPFSRVRIKLFDQTSKVLVLPQHLNFFALLLLFSCQYDLSQKTGILKLTLSQMIGMTVDTSLPLPHPFLPLWNGWWTRSMAIKLL